ncbi:DUF3500 domain-containing protein [Streptomyces longwoodensis]|uniref:DUF3500 domain-containing protein n=1 Tax=Streptomyces longwoodensis TaxID=68231 RepID=UPI0036FCEBDB
MTASAASQVLTATNAFLATLSSSQKTAVQAARTQANLSKWSNLPDALFKRAGLRMDSLRQPSRRRCSTSSSRRSATPVTSRSPASPTATVWIRILGTPSSTSKWTIQYGGHHLAVNIDGERGTLDAVVDGLVGGGGAGPCEPGLTLSGSTMTLGPTLWGAQPTSSVLPS